MMGSRVFIIRGDEQNLFPKNISLSSLGQMIAGQGHDWPDNTILKHNKLTITTGANHTLLDMLDKGRFDYFPRALHEPWIEIKDNSKFTVEKNLMLQYPAPLYFFVNKNNLLLRDRITLGLNKALNNGKFDKFFNEHLITRDTLDRANIQSRKVFHLVNPQLSEQTKAIISNPRLWLNNLH